MHSRFCRLRGQCLRLSTRPQIEVPLPGGVDADAALGRVASELGHMRLRVPSGAGRVVASSTRISLVGSPLSHRLH